MRQDTADAIVTSRLLILQAKRLMLNSAQRRFDGGRQSLRGEVDRLRSDTASAQHGYRTAMLRLGSPKRNEYWLVAYSRLIEMGNALSTKLRNATTDLPVSERYEASADVEMLEDIVGRWTESMRASMADAVG